MTRSRNFIIGFGFVAAFVALGIVERGLARRAEQQNAQLVDAPPVGLREGSGGLTELPESVAGVTVEGVSVGNIVAVGRTARLHDEGELPVYFSPRDRLCPVDSDLASRDVGAMTVNDAGDVVVVGGLQGATELSRANPDRRDGGGASSRRPFASAKAAKSSPLPPCCGGWPTKPRRRARPGSATSLSTRAPAGSSIAVSAPSM